MNIVFWLIVILALVFIWFAACSLFKPLGAFVSRIFNDAVDSINEKDDKGEKDS